MKAGRQMRRSCPGAVTSHLAASSVLSLAAASDFPSDPAGPQVELVLEMESFLLHLHGGIGVYDSSSGVGQPQL